MPYFLLILCFENYNGSDPQCNNNKAKINERGTNHLEIFTWMWICRIDVNQLVILSQGERLATVRPFSFPNKSPSAEPGPRQGGADVFIQSVFGIALLLIKTKTEFSRTLLAYSPNLERGGPQPIHGQGNFIKIFLPLLCIQDDTVR